MHLSWSAQPIRNLLHWFLRHHPSVPISYAHLNAHPLPPSKKRLWRDPMKIFLVAEFLGLAVIGLALDFEGLIVSKLPSFAAALNATPPLMVPLTVIPSAASAGKGAVCMDGSLPGYHLDRGYGSGVNNWLVNLEGGGWCNSIGSCVLRKTTRRGSSNYMEKEIPFTGILSNKPEENPDFFNWNRVKVRYCDGASFLGEGINQAEGLFFRGQRIWLAAIEDLMSIGMRAADQALLSGCSAGGLATIHHCDEFWALFPENTKVKCFADAGLFLDVFDVAGGHTIRSFFEGVVSLLGVVSNLPHNCTSHMNATSCFFPQNILGNIQTPLFLLNSAYDVWQLQESLAPSAADPQGYWKTCKSNHSNCGSYQIQFLQEFRNEMLKVVNGFLISRQDGLFINSCFAHCQSERQDTWYGSNSPVIGNKGIAESVGDWYFDRSEVKAIDCPYPCVNKSLPPQKNEMEAHIHLKGYRTRHVYRFLMLITILQHVQLACLKFRIIKYIILS